MAFACQLPSLGGGPDPTPPWGTTPQESWTLSTWKFQNCQSAQGTKVQGQLPLSPAAIWAVRRMIRHRRTVTVNECWIPCVGTMLLHAMSHILLLPALGVDIIISSFYRWRSWSTKRSGGLLTVPAPKFLSTSASWIASLSFNASKDLLLPGSTFGSCF